MRRAAARQELACVEVSLVVERKIIEKDESQLDEGAGEGRRQRLEGTGRANRGHRGAIEWLFAGRARERGIGHRYVAVLHDLELNYDHALVAKARGFRNDGVPISLYRGQQPAKVGIEIHALDVYKRQVIAGGENVRGLDDIHHPVRNALALGF